MRSNYCGTTVLDTWPYNSKQTLSLRFPICYCFSRGSANAIIKLKMFNTSFFLGSFDIILSFLLCFWKRWIELQSWWNGWQNMNIGKKVCSENCILNGEANISTVRLHFLTWLTSADAAMKTENIICVLNMHHIA